MKEQNPPSSYQAALEELEAIQHALENHDVPLDDLSAQVVRARFLLSYCQKMLRQTQQEIDKIFDTDEDAS